jgi:aromatase
MTDGQRSAEHEIVVAAPAAGLHRLISGVENWPRIFPPTIHVELLERHDREERIRIWATANGEPKSWTSRRVLDPDNLRVEFRQEVSAPPVASMSGAWLIEALPDDRSRVRLLHTYRAVDDDPAALDWIADAVDRNSRAELDALKTNAELAHSAEGLAFTFEDTVQVDGAVQDVYDFLNDAHLWSRRLPHVVAVDLAEPAPGVQSLEMETRATDGSTHVTKSYRVTFPHHRIAYKQVTLPALMTVHTGCWTLVENERGVAATSQHAVMLNTANIAAVLGSDASVADARAYVERALSANSRATLAHAKDYAEKVG